MKIHFTHVLWLLAGVILTGNALQAAQTPTANNGDSRAGGFVGGWLTIFKGAPNVDLAKKLALDLLDPNNFTKISSIAGGLFMPAYENLWTPELIAADPNFAIIKEQVSVDKPFLGWSWPAAPAAQIDAIRAQSVLEQAVGNAISGRMSAADAVKDGHDKIVQIFEEGGIMQP
jgi:multiple sugar transport system substrate-binding protein